MVYALLVGHFVGDFLLQSDWMAVNKSKRWDALMWHVCAYMAALVFILGFAVEVEDYRAILIWFGVNFAAHFVQDAITSRITSRLWFIDGARLTLKGQDELMAIFNAMDMLTPLEAWRGGRRALTEPGCYEIEFNDKRHWFFVAIGADQLIHYVTLVATAAWLLQ